jgi:hypothetical protein
MATLPASYCGGYELGYHAGWDAAALLYGSTNTTFVEGGGLVQILIRCTLATSNKG